MTLASWPVVLVLGIVFGFGFTVGQAVASTIVGWLRK